MKLKARKGMSYPAVIENVDSKNFEEVAYMIESRTRSSEEILKLAHKMAVADEMLMCCEASLVYLKLSNHLSKEELMLELERVIKKARGEV